MNENNQEHALLQSKTLQKLKLLVDELGIVRGFRADSRNEFAKNRSTSTLTARDYHNTVAHSGRSATLQEIRRAGYWIINCNALVCYVIFNCIRCKSMQGKFGEQIVADTPKDGVSEALTFIYCGVDLFGPFLLNVRQSQLKRYGALFTCPVSRAVHIEVVATMQTDLFIMALRRMIARRSNIRSVRGDNGTNFMGTYNDIKRAF